jgi:hypothetical protein
MRPVAVYDTALGPTVAIIVQYPCRILSYTVKPGEVGSPLQVRVTVLFVPVWALSWSDEGLESYATESGAC